MRTAWFSVGIFDDQRAFRSYYTLNRQSNIITVFNDELDISCIIRRYVVDRANRRSVRIINIIREIGIAHDLTVGICHLKIAAGDRNGWRLHTVYCFDFRIECNSRTCLYIYDAAEQLVVYDQPSQPIRYFQNTAGSDFTLLQGQTCCDGHRIQHSG